MNGILDFLADYYILFIILSVVLLFALIGFIAGERKKNKNGVQTASATDLPINNTETTVQPTNTVVAPETPVMMSEPVNEPVQMETPVVNEPQVPEVEASIAPALVIDEPVQSTNTEVVPETPVMMNEPVASEPVQMEAPVVNEPQAPEVEASVVPTLVIDEPVQPTNTEVVPETPVMMNEPVASEPVQMEAPVVNEPQVPEVEVSNAPTLVIDEPVQNESMTFEEPVQMETSLENEIVAPEVEVPTISETEVPAQDNTLLEPTMNIEETNNAEQSLVNPEPPIADNVLEPTMEEQNTNENSIFENPDMTGTTSIFENEINNQNN